MVAQHEHDGALQSIRGGELSPTAAGHEASRRALVITLRRAAEREHLGALAQGAWSPFILQDRVDRLGNGFGRLAAFEEGRLPPRTTSRQPSQQDAEIITYVRQGTLAYKDSTGRAGLISAGEFQRMTASPGIRYSETNFSPSEWAQTFQIWLHPSASGLTPGHEQQRFSAADRRGVMCVVASPDGQKRSLRVHQDAFLYSTLLARGQHVIHELAETRCAWLHIVEGAVRFRAITLGTGDGVGIVGEQGVALTASEETEALLLDLGELGTAEPLIAPIHA